MSYKLISWCPHDKYHPSLSISKLILIVQSHTESAADPVRELGTLTSKMGALPFKCKDDAWQQDVTWWLLFSLDDEAVYNHQHSMTQLCRGLRSESEMERNPEVPASTCHEALFHCTKPSGVPSVNQFLTRLSGTCLLEFCTQSVSCVFLCCVYRRRVARWLCPAPGSSCSRLT